MTAWQDHPLVLPENYRVVFRWFWHVRVQGRHHWCESLRVLQRINRKPGWETQEDWVDLGFWDEFFPTKGPPRPWDAEIPAGPGGEGWG
jgi:hypothetical protein